MLDTSTINGVVGGVRTHEPQQLRGVMTMTDTLKTEIETYLREKDRLVAESAGKYVLIHGTYVIGVWDTYEDALKEGYERFLLKPFLVKHIEAIEKVHFFTRDLSLCQS